MNMIENRFQKTLQNQNTDIPPIWFMRQAGRYQKRYQHLREKHSFEDLCKIPALAKTVTLDPIETFDFDAAILFSDILFPLEALGMPLSYRPGPQFGFLLESFKQVKTLKKGGQLESFLAFQYEALELIKKELPKEKFLLGFTGAPLTLFTFATSGSHQGDIQTTRAGFTDGRWEFFLEKLLPLLAKNILNQAKAGADAIVLFDSAWNRFTHKKTSILNTETSPKASQRGVEILAERFALKKLFSLLKAQSSSIPSILYFAKGASQEDLKALSQLPITAFAIDETLSLKETLRAYQKRIAIQGNIPTRWLLLSKGELEKKLFSLFSDIASLPSSLRKGWILSLSHGILPQTQEENVHFFIEFSRAFWKTQIGLPQEEGEGLNIRNKKKEF